MCAQALGLVESQFPRVRGSLPVLSLMAVACARAQDVAGVEATLRLMAQLDVTPESREYGWVANTAASAMASAGNAQWLHKVCVCMRAAREI